MPFAPAECLQLKGCVAGDVMVPDHKIFVFVDLASLSCGPGRFCTRFIEPVLCGGLRNLYTRSNVHIRHVRMKGVFLSPHSRCVPARSITNPAWNIHPQHSFDHTDRAVFAVGKKRKSCVLVGVWWEESLAPARFIDCALFADNAIAGASTHSSRVRLTPCPLPIRHPLVMPPTTAAAAGWRAVVVPSETAIIIDGRNQRDVG